MLDHKLTSAEPLIGEDLNFPEEYLSLVTLEWDSLVLSVKLDAPAPCRLDASDLDLICYASADCLHQHLQVI